ncbi:MAG: hypothetical protein KatS3mg054_0461 [Chloroflexus sp.]|nr:MAG: hypothetical protein KatS3mg054_0193 [Chloroflexus sp.]GIV86196.1 MAG: hypothetical protein KatS3mg054_0225 [Chloroflexus sp.]GIV86394.1 MAG: hypothetical protein KatS3mg054_0423 [Chloroflexus sp.]GIV86432.1 MAG: hypothetical protein KatS3mg054_0461 [Chloroflexus sp.]
MRFIERVLNQLRELDRNPVETFDYVEEVVWSDIRAELVGQLAGWLDEEGHAKGITFEELLDMCRNISYADVETLDDLLHQLF